MPTNPPGVFINDIPLIAQNLIWGLTPGPVPYSTNIKVPLVNNEEFLAFENPVTMRWVFEFGINGAIQEKEMKFDNLILHDPRVISEFYVMWKLSDSRYNLRGKKSFFAKNVTRIRNQVGTIDAPTQEKIGLDNASQLRQPFDTIKRGRYIPSSLIDENGLPSEDGSPLKVSQVLQEVLQKAGLDLDVSRLDDDGDYVLENMISEGEDVGASIASLLRRNRLQIGIRKNGGLHLYSVDFFDDGNVNSIAEIQDRIKIGPGRIYKENLKNIRPKKIRILFKKIKEVRVVLTEEEESFLPSPSTVPERRTSAIPPKISNSQTSPETVIFDIEDIESRRAISCINVARVSFVPSNFRGVVRIGEFVTMKDYLFMLGIGEELVRKHWFSNKLEQEVNKILGGLIPNQIEAITTMATATIRQHYRQIFMIDPFHMDDIKEIQARRATVIDNFSGKRRPSELWTNLCFFPRGRDIEKARGRVVEAKHAVNYIVNEVDPLRENPTPGTINIIDNDLGVFSVSFPKVSDTMIASVVPSALETLPEATPGGNFAGSSLLLAKHPLKEDHTMETIVSVIWRYDKDGKTDTRQSDKGDSSVYFDIEYDFSDTLGEGFGPDVEYLSPKEYARIDPKGVLHNNDVLQAIADSEAAKLAHQYRDRFRGMVELPGLVDLELTGNMNSILYSVADGVSPRTIIDMNDRPPEPELAQTLPDEVRRYMLRQLDPGDA